MARSGVIGRHYPDVGLFEDTARIAERGLIDPIFFGDSTGIRNTWEGSMTPRCRLAAARYEPLDHRDVARLLNSPPVASIGNSVDRRYHCPKSRT